MDFGDWLAERRHEAGLTMRGLARKSGLSAPYIATIERGTSEPPPLRTCKALARAFGMQSEEIWRRAFAARLEKWVRRQGFSRISSEALVEISKRIEEGDKQAR